MLLANMTVAKALLEYNPQLAFLRYHAPPTLRMMKELKKMLMESQIDFDISSSLAIHNNLQKCLKENGNILFLKITVVQHSLFPDLAKSLVLNHLLAKPMTRAQYVCASEREDLSHYALNVPLYTHFTSPIRRYADIMVHRLLAASLGTYFKLLRKYTHYVYSTGLVDSPKWDAEYVEDVAKNCNKQKYNAKKAGDASSELFFASYVENHQPQVQDAVVCGVLDRSIDLLIMVTGTVTRLYFMVRQLLI